jgi:hypothetical protein
MIRKQAKSLFLCIFLTATVAISPVMAIEQEKPHIRVLKQFTCSGKVGSYFAGIADRSIGGGDNMCYFISNSGVGKKILKNCKIGENCRVIGTVDNDADAGDWSPIIVDIDLVKRMRD